MLDLVGPAYPSALKRLNETIARVDANRRWVHYHGAVPFNELHHHYAQADLGLFASSCESMPNILLKRLTARVLPPEFDRQRKQGFSIPLGEWLKGGAFRTLFHEMLRDPQCSFDAQTIDSLLRRQERGRSNGERLFALVLFELWRREYGVTF